MSARKVKKKKIKYNSLHDAQDNFRAIAKSCKAKLKKIV